MNEYPLQYLSFGNLVWTSVFALLYGIGGIERKWLRRYVGPSWMGIGIFIFAQFLQSWSLVYLLYPFLLSASLHLGYGGSDVTKIKIRKRATYGFCLGISAIPIVINSGLWLLFCFHLALCVASSVLFGVFNPTKDARSEETLIGLLSTIMVLFLI